MPKNNKTKDWEKEFDEKFTRINKSTGKFEEKWFVKDTITAKEVKQFISNLQQEDKAKYIKGLEEIEKIIKEMNDVLKSQETGFGYDTKRLEKWMKGWKQGLIDKIKALKDE